MGLWRGSMRSVWIAMLMIAFALAHDNDHNDHNGYEYSAGMFELLGLIILICVCVWCMLPSDAFTAVLPKRCCEVRIDSRDVRRGGPVSADDPYAVGPDGMTR